MPQLVPFFFVNQIIFGFLTLFILIYLTSKYILPRYLETYLIRSYIKKL